MSLPRPPRSTPLRRFVFGLLLLSGSLLGAAEASPAAGEAAEDDVDDVTVLPALEVKGERVEEFGFRFNVTIRIPGTDTVIVSEVWPNTAASKAGLKPGDRILKVDGKTPSALSLGLKPNKIQERKWAELAAGKSRATLVLEVRGPDEKTSRTVTLTIPSALPRWGTKPWSAPEGRAPAVVAEAGPLAALAGKVLDNGIWSMGLSGAGGTPHLALGYEWRLVQPDGTHRIWATQQFGRTEVVLERRSRTLGGSYFLTSPSGAMDEGHGTTPKRKNEKRRPFTEDEVRAGFEAEVDFWLHQVGPGTGRWPFEALPAGSATRNASAAPETAVENPRTRAASFLQLTPATTAQRKLLLEALNKVGLDADGWAYTETSRGLNDERAVTVRIDPSLPPEQTTTLLRVDGKPPKESFLKKWRDEGRTALPGLGELPPLSSLVDEDDIRFVADETSSVVFELPVKASNTEFPAEKFQARFRVNKSFRGLEDFSIKLREAMSVAGVAKVTDAGLEVRFRLLDPAAAPQPVWLKLGGGVRVLFVKLSRAVEVNRTDFKRVEPRAL